jgi:hypothetical protein
MQHRDGHRGKELADRRYSNMEPTSPVTSAAARAHGSAACTKTQTGHCTNPFLVEPIWRRTNDALIEAFIERFRVEWSSAH